MFYFFYILALISSINFVKYAPLEHYITFTHYFAVVLPNPPLRISVASSSTVIPYSTKIPCMNPVSAGIVRVLFSLESFVIFEKMWPSLSE